MVEDLIDAYANTGSSTRLYDAVHLTIRERLNQIKGRKAIVLFTDGVEEATNPNGEYYGVERLGRAITDSLHLDIGDLTQAIVDDILTFSGNQALADDVCLVAVEAVRNESFLTRASVQPVSAEQERQTAPP